MRRNETPERRKNPSGRIVWKARYTGQDGQRRMAPRPATFRLKGPCRSQEPDGLCCATHRIWWCYEQDEPAEGWTVGQYFGLWLERHPRPERTAKTYDSRIRAVLDVKVDGQPLREWSLWKLRRRQIAALVDVMLREQGRAASGTRAVVSTLRAMCEDAILDDRMELNPAQGVRIREKDPRIQKPRREAVVMSFEEMHAFARHAGPHEPLVRIMSDCGLRLGEALALEAKHVRGDVLTVEQNVWEGRIYAGTKSGARRETPIPPTLRRMLAPLVLERVGLLFPDRQGRVADERSFYDDVWYPLQRRSGVMLRPHDLRHSWVSLMRAAGVDPADLALSAGHTVATATGSYTHSVGGTFDLMRKAAG